MFDSYKDIFNQRGRSYHEAMMRYPTARREEFEWAIRYADLAGDMRLCDVPSGGCYLQEWLPPGMKLVSVETSSEFIQCAETPADDGNTIVVCEDLGDIPLESESVERAISLAGSHHLEDRPAFYREVQRILKSQGIFALADVEAGSGVDTFLNGFVDQHNSMGHKGDFLGRETVQELEAAGFQVTKHEPVTYHWRFEQRSQMVDFCRLLFCIDLATEQQVLQAIEDHLDYEESAGQCSMQWGLYFFQAVKPDAGAH
jgi:SAM-dependent methyltransferase